MALKCAVFLPFSCQKLPGNGPNGKIVVQGIAGPAERCCGQFFDEVIAPDVTWIASVAPIVYVGAEPVLVDIRADTWCLDVDAVRSAIGPRTKAILGVDLYGSMCDWGALGTRRAPWPRADRRRSGGDGLDLQRRARRGPR